MGAVEFGQLVARRQKELQRLEGENAWSQNKIASRFGLLPNGKGLDSTQVRLIKEGKRILNHALVGRLIVVLRMDEDPDLEAEAWHAAGLKQPGMTLDDYLESARRRAGTARDRRSDREIETDTAPTGAVVEAESGRNGDCKEPTQEVAA